MTAHLAAAFIKAKRAFGPALKDKNNPAFRSKYADLGACIDAVEDALLSNGIAFIQETSKDDTGVTVETVFLHESGEERRCGVLHVPAAKQDPQGYGSALTYARRYSLMAACGIAPEDDDGNTASKPRSVPQLVNARTGEVLTGKPLDQQLSESIEQAKQRKGGVMGAVLDDMNLDPKVIGALQNLSEKLMAGFDKFGAEDAFDFIAKQGLNNDEEIYLHSMLPSKVRSAIKAVGESRKPVVNRRDVAPA
jgi:hypothetical protein